jgi:hypothetical protein
MRYERPGQPPRLALPDTRPDWIGMAGWNDHIFCICTPAGLPQQLPIPAAVIPPGDAVLALTAAQV